MWFLDFGKSKYAHKILKINVFPPMVLNIFSSKFCMQVFFLIVGKTTVGLLHNEMVIMKLWLSWMSSCKNFASRLQVEIKFVFLIIKYFSSYDVRVVCSCASAGDPAIFWGTLCYRTMEDHFFMNRTKVEKK